MERGADLRFEWSDVPVRRGLLSRHREEIVRDLSHKHRVEWKEADWAAPIKNRTIAAADALGLSLMGYHNMSHALRELEIYSNDMASLGTIVGNWRESVADHLRAEGAKHGVAIHPRYPEDSEIAEPAPVPSIILDDDAPF